MYIVTIKITIKHISCIFFRVIFIRSNGDVENIGSKFKNTSNGILTFMFLLSYKHREIKEEQNQDNFSGEIG